MLLENPRVADDPTTLVQEYENAKLDLMSTLEKRFKSLRLSASGAPLKKHQIKQVFVSLKFRFTRLGATLQDVLQLDVPRYDAAQGVVFPDQYAYDVFKAMFDPFLEQRHFGFTSTHRQPPVFWGDWTNIPDLDPQRKFIQWASVSVSRNLDGFRFTPTMMPVDLGKVSDVIVKALDKLPPEYSGNYISLQRILPEWKQQLEYDRCLFYCGDPTESSDRFPRFWPFGRGLLVHESRAFVVWVNAKDHLRVISQDSTGDLQNVYRRIADVMPEFDNLLPPARHNRIGHITVNPDDVGTGLSVLVEIKLPGVPEDAIDRVSKAYDLDIRLFEDDLYQVSSRSLLGKTEFELMIRFCTGIQKLLSMVLKASRWTTDSFQNYEMEAEGNQFSKDIFLEQPKRTLSHHGIPDMESTGLVKRRSRNGGKKLKKSTRETTTGDVEHHKK